MPSSVLRGSAATVAIGGAGASRSRFPTVSVLTVSFGLSLIGCHDLTGSQKLPAGTQDPSWYNSVSGAIGMRNAAVYAFGQALPDYIVKTGLLTDELTDPGVLTASTGSQLSNGGAILNPLDERILPELPYGTSQSYASDVTYKNLQGVRTSLLQAMGQLAMFATDTSAKDTVILTPAVGRVRRGELYALYGYTELMLADFFCSGVPLSTLDFQKDFTYRSGSATAQIYQDAVAHFDTALALSVDSARILNLARVGLGRAYLDLGNITAAADDVSGVPSDYLYQISGQWGGASGLICLAGEGSCAGSSQIWMVSDSEGTNGFSYISSSDPRAMDTVISILHSGNGSGFSALSVGYPKLYKAGLTGTNYASVTVASGVEARLIQAEAAERAGDASWITILNTLRTTGGTLRTYTRLCDSTKTDANGNITQMGSPCPANIVDTTWSPGTGIGLLPPSVLADVGPVCPVPGMNGSLACPDTVWYKGLRLLTDPGIGSPNPDSARLAMVFRERAMWLYLTGHRQGDLRRQRRQYSTFWRDQSVLYPAGVYLGLGAGFYGADVTAPIPGTEYLNPQFHGCLNRAP